MELTIERLYFSSIFSLFKEILYELTIHLVPLLLVCVEGQKSFLTLKMEVRNEIPTCKAF